MFKRLAGCDSTLSDEELQILKKVYCRAVEKIKPKGYNERADLIVFILENYRNGSRDEGRLLAAVDRKRAGLAA